MTMLAEGVDQYVTKTASKTRSMTFCTMAKNSRRARTNPRVCPATYDEIAQAYKMKDADTFLPQFNPKLASTFASNFELR
jgi:hypothetical protein